MSKPGFESLVEKLPKIAEIVNAFTSEEVQKLAFSTLLMSLGVESSDEQPTDSGVSTPDTPSDAVKKPKQRKSIKKDTSKKSITRAVAPDGQLDLYPNSKPSFKDFVASKKEVENNYDRDILAIYYLKEELGMDVIGVSQVVACYDDRNWPLPIAINSLRLTARRKKWIDVSNIENLQLTNKGRNRVNHDMVRESDN